jgi:hypothetical protein
MPSPNIQQLITQSYPIKNVPLSIRPVGYLSQLSSILLHLSKQAVLVLFATWLIILGVLGLAPLREVPINDKVLHFFGVSILNPSVAIFPMHSVGSRCAALDGDCDVSPILYLRRSRVRPPPQHLSQTNLQCFLPDAQLITENMVLPPRTDDPHPVRRVLRPRDTQ